MELFILARSFLLPNIENKAWLPYNSQIFNYVEIDSTFYNIPSKQMVTTGIEEHQIILDLQQSSLK